MPNYRLYCVDGKGHFAQVHEIDATSDAEALAAACALNLPVKCELWDKGRLITILEPPRAATSRA